MLYGSVPHSGGPQRVEHLPTPYIYAVTSECLYTECIVLLSIPLPCVVSHSPRRALNMELRLSNHLASNYSPEKA